MARSEGPKAAWTAPKRAFSRGSTHPLARFNIDSTYLAPTRFRWRTCSEQETELEQVERGKGVSGKVLPGLLQVAAQLLSVWSNFRWVDL